MAASIDDYLETYQQAYTAYAQQKYEVAATLIDQVVQNLPDDPNSHLLRGHIYYVLQEYDVAKIEYETVLQLTKVPEIIDFAKNGIDSINQLQEALELENSDLDDEQVYIDLSDAVLVDDPELEDLAASANDSFNLNSLSEEQAALPEIEELSLENPFDIPTQTLAFESKSDSAASLSDDPFKLNEQPTEQESGSQNWEEQVELDLPHFWKEDSSAGSLDEPEVNNPFLDTNANIGDNQSHSPFAEVDVPTSSNIEISTELLMAENEPISSSANLELPENGLENSTEMLNNSAVQESYQNINNLQYTSQDDFPPVKAENWVGKRDSQENVPEVPASFQQNFTLEEPDSSSSINGEITNFDGDDNFDFEAFESAFGSEELSQEEDTTSTLNRETAKSNIEFLDDFDEFDDLGNIPGFDLTTGESSLSEVGMSSGALNTNGRLISQDSEIPHSQGSTERDEELFTITGSQEAVPVFTPADVSKLEPNVTVEQGWLALLENASLERKQWLVAGAVGVVSALMVATVSFAATTFSPAPQRESVRNTGWAMALAAGLAGGLTAGVMGNLTLKQIRRTTKDLQAQFDAVRQGNLNVEATVYSEDELGMLATGFNEMARVIFTTTNEAQRKADEQEEAKENLQRQVIRLLDDVEGAARGDLTVQAEVTADVLGAVADAFNLTIQNLRDIVQQVTVAAKEVTKNATNSETFARALSSDALRQAEELANTLNSVQVMTDSIQRVAEAAREAETVARDASTIALKGGEAVENTVAGILEIRETVAETTRKVKRLAESSQEISKIVALISQIASRTNLLALNASIEAARAGEAGRGFAIVADEVRQLADKSAKSLKEIEQIVMQIQSETGSVMTAMEEGTQQVIKGTKLAEEAKRSLENIIQVANRIDILVRSITSDTVEQTETSRAVAQVMQNVELTAQETSQEAQRVSGSLQNLVGVSRDLIASVERFRVETMESR